MHFDYLAGLVDYLDRRLFIFPCSVGRVSSDSGLFHGDVVVLDEVHYLSDISRGTVWEEIVRTFHSPSISSIFFRSYFTECSLGLTIVQIVFKVIYCPEDVQLICLSATVANPDELAGWIGQVILLSCVSFCLP